MSYLASYKRLSKLIRQESYEPMFSWGIRMALSGMLPILWGLYNHRLDDAAWIALTAEAISWVEMKGSFTWRVRTLLAGALFSVVFALLGTVTGFNVWLSVGGMLVVGFFATLLKNIGDRASGLALCVYLMYIICNGYPSNNVHEVEHRMFFIGIGALWPVVLGLAFSAIMPAEQPFRRQIALIWRSTAELINTMSTYAAGSSPWAMRDALILKEKEVRAAIDNSYQFYGKMVHQVSEKDNQKYQLALLRKAAGLVSINVIAIADELEPLTEGEQDEQLKLKFGIIFSALQEAVTRVSVFVLTLKPEEKLLAVSHINRLKNLSGLVWQYLPQVNARKAEAIKRILKNTNRCTKLLESALDRITQMGIDKPVFRSYSLIKTSFLLKPKYLWRNFRGLFNFNTLTTRYALRSAIAAAVALFITKWFNVDHGYWCALSVMIVKQPYFGATLSKAIDRVVGTLLGVLAGSLLLRVPTDLHVKEGILFLTFFFMVYYIRRNYAFAVFVITVNLVLLFNLELAYNNLLMVSRVICTVGGAMLAVASGFALFPAWDKKWLPAHLAGAIARNYEYLIATFFAPGRVINWTRNKRLAESETSNVFDSFNRYMEEPGTEKSDLYYHLATCNMRITRNLNNIHIEEDEKHSTTTRPTPILQQLRINECVSLYNKILPLLPALDPHTTPKMITPAPDFQSPFTLSAAQMHSLEKLIIELKTMGGDLEQLIPSALNGEYVGA